MAKKENVKAVDLRSNSGDRRQDNGWDLRPETGDRRQNNGDRRRDNAEMR